MKEEKMERISRKLAVFDFKRLQELVTLFKVLEREELSLEDVKDYIKNFYEMRKIQRAKYDALAEARQKLWDKNAPRCSLCDKPLLARRITVPEGKANVKGYTCLWFCQEEKCTFEEYTKENFQEVYKKIMEV